MRKLGRGLLVIVGVLAAPGAVFADLDCDLGDRLYEQASEAKTDAETIRLLRQSATVCPDASTAYQLGRALLRGGEAVDALTAFQDAVRLAGEDAWARALALARIAEARRELGQVPEAVAAIGQAMRLAGAETPDWMFDLAMAIDSMPGRAELNAGQMARAFTASRSFGSAAADKGFGAVASIDLYVLFDTDSAVLGAAGLHQVRELGKALQSIDASGKTVLILGHTDRHGSAAYNQSLSLRRAQSVVRELKPGLRDVGVQLRAEGRGESELKYRGEDADSDALNRRVEVRLMSGY